MKTRTKQQVYNDLLSCGLSKRDSELASEGAGLEGVAANSFAYDNGNKFHLSEEQALRLLRLILPSYEMLVKKFVHVPLVQHEFDSLVSFAYNPGGRLRSVTTFINNGQIEAAMACMNAANTSGGKVMKALTVRRRRETNLYRHGRYEL
ncbi:glycoside hydrolase family protein [Geomonas agri]|uniref:glycoside hydrolase family protein n=1 Tax=Geomonas agri TaxID=2873702 RepID=UPI001CD40A7E|nr:glycoside hydrolase family protein [Geomonas agri]